MLPDIIRVDVRGLSIAVHRLGSGSDPAVLGLHGFLDHGLSFARVARTWSGGTFFSPDARGHGESDWVGSGGYYHFYDYLDDLRRVLDKLPTSLGLVGHSMGGTLALTLAGLFPDRFRWVLLLEGMGPPTHRPEDTPQRLQAWLQSLTPARLGGIESRRRIRTRLASVEDAADRLVRMNGRLDSGQARELAESFTEVHPEGGLAWRFDPLHRTPSAKPFRLDEVEPVWRRIQAPVTSVWGQHGFRPDQLEARHAMLPSVRVGVVPDAGHNLHHEQPEVVASAIADLEEEPARLPPGLRSVGPDAVL